MHAVSHDGLPSGSPYTLLSDAAWFVIAGTGIPGYLNGPAMTATFDLPVAASAVGSTLVFIADSHRNVIRTLQFLTPAYQPLLEKDRFLAYRSLP